MGLATGLKGNIHDIIISNEVGNYLVEVVDGKTINPSLISAFVSGLAQLGKENLGILYDIAIHGEGLNLIVLMKFNLVLIAVFDPGINPEDAKTEATEILEDFHKRYEIVLTKWDGNQDVFKSYVQSLRERISLCYKRTPEIKENLLVNSITPLDTLEKEKEMKQF